MNIYLNGGFFHSEKVGKLKIRCRENLLTTGRRHPSNMYKGISEIKSKRDFEDDDDVMAQRKKNTACFRYTSAEKGHTRNVLRSARTYIGRNRRLDIGTEREEAHLIFFNGKEVARVSGDSLLFFFFLVGIYCRFTL